MITSICKNCEENWTEKDICYVIGNIYKNQSIKSIWFVCGDCYSANPKIYTRIKDSITNNIRELDIELSQTNEIAKIKKVDPLGITDLRVRGMWSTKHPSKVFNYITTKNITPYIKVIMLSEKFYSFDNAIRHELSKKTTIKEIKIQNPNNPAHLMEGILIDYEYN